MIEKDLLPEIDKKLSLIIKLLGQLVIAETSQTEAIVKLNRLGLDRNSIAEIMGTSPQAVSVRISEAKRKKKSKKIERGQ
jgi:DNA-binding NarL/FixJ family response regulator